MSSLSIVRKSVVEGVVQSLPSSKSLSNRALLIDALIHHSARLENLSSARDTRLMESLIRTPDHVINVKDAGTTMRFLTAYFALTGQSKILTGTDRMKERPIHLLVTALRELGADISYLEKEGFPPVETKGFRTQLTNRISIRGDVSSQFISALMMVAPALPDGLTIHMTGKIGSWPYLVMTAELMKHFGQSPQLGSDTITIAPGKYQPNTYRVEPDWSAASYWYGFTALAETANILLPGVTAVALQGDKVITEIMALLGVQSSFGNDGLTLSRVPVKSDRLVWDFANCPDLAQTIFPVCAMLGVPGEFTGLESLKIKETDRIAALRNELAQVGAQLREDGNTWTLTPGPVLNKHPFIRTYHDHRMAMGFAPLATRMDISIEDPDVVNKSYPTFWEDMKHLGFKMEN